MSMMGNIAVEGAMEDILKHIQWVVKTLPLNQQIEAIKNYVEGIKKTANSGWY